MTHTPGPWTLERRKVFDDCILYAAQENDFSARVHGSNLEADARLIAAAPELLKALKLLEAELSDRGDLDCVKQARAAIAKAEGSEQTIRRRHVP